MENVTEKERTYSSIRLLSNEEREKIEKILFNYGLFTHGGSVEDGVDGKILHIIVKSNGTIGSEDNIAIALMDAVGVDIIQMNGKLMSRESIESERKYRNNPFTPEEEILRRHREEEALRRKDRPMEVHYRKVRYASIRRW